MEQNNWYQMLEEIIDALKREYPELVLRKIIHVSEFYHNINIIIYYRGKIVATAASKLNDNMVRKATVDITKHHVNECAKLLLMEGVKALLELHTEIGLSLTDKSDQP